MQKKRNIAYRAKFLFVLFVDYSVNIRLFAQFQSEQSWFLLVDIDGLSAWNAVKHFVALHPHVNGRWVVHANVIHRPNKGVVGGYVAVDLSVGSIPNVISATNLCQKIFHYIPIVVVIKLVAMSPNVEKKTFSVLVFF